MNGLLAARVVVFAIIPIMVVGAVDGDEPAADAVRRSEAPQSTVQKTTKYQRHRAEFTVRAIDQNRNLVASALVGSYGYRNADQGDRWHIVAGIAGDKVRLATTDTNGEAILFVDSVPSRSRSRSASRKSELVLVARSEARKLVGIKPVSRDELLSASEAKLPIEISLEPECRVFGRVESTHLTALKLPLEPISVCVNIDNRSAFGFDSSKPTYEFFLPPGTYTLSVDGNNAIGSEIPFTVSRGTAETQLNTVNLPAQNMVPLAGQPAPELADVVAWKNSEPLKLAELHGRYVLLDFWGYWCGKCIEEMPKLFDLQAQYKQRLLIIGVHVGFGDDGIDTVEELDAKLSECRKTTWGGRDVPFPVAMLAARRTTHRESDRSASTQTSADYGVEGYPSQVLIDPRGNVIGPFNPKEHLKLFD